MYKRLLTIIALAIAPIMPYAASAVTVTSDLQGVLVKGTQPAVYFYGEDGKRYVFPSEKIFYTWYSDFNSVLTLTDEQLAAIPIGGNVTYRPGTKLVKLTTDPKVYAVSGKGQLRWIMTEEVARAIYGDDWAQQVHDVSDAYFVDYEINEPIEAASEYVPAAERSAYASLSTFVSDEGNASEDTADSSDRNIVLSHVSGNDFRWTDNDVSPLGYKLVWSKNHNPEYPTRSGDSYNYYGESSTKNGSIGDDLSGTYYVRVCEYLGGHCGEYSNEVSVTFAGSNDEEEEESEESVSSENHTIVLTNLGDRQFSWTDKAVSPMGYKLVWSKNQNPEYPTRSGDSYNYYGESSTKSGRIDSELSSGTYYVRVCEYLGGHCGAYSNQVSFTVAAGSSSDSEEEDDEESVSSGNHTIVLTSLGDRQFSWTDTAVSSMGYKLVYSQNAHPEYPTREGDSYIYYGSSSDDSGTIEDDLESGETYHVRVCEYLGGECGAYSNEVTFVAE